MSIETFSDTETETDIVYPLQSNSSKYDRSKYKKMRTIKLKDFANIKNKFQNQPKSIVSPLELKKPEGK